VTASEIVILTRAHELFAGAPVHRPTDVDLAGMEIHPGGTGRTATAHWSAATMSSHALSAAQGIDAEMSQILDGANRDHRGAHHSTAAVLAAARADAELVPNNPVAVRELLRRRIIRLRAQRGYVLAARRRVRRRRSALLALRYRQNAARAQRHSARADAAVRAALSRLGCPYVWGAAGPDRFDCSGLVKWAYERAGVRLHRTTYDQINDGIPISPSHIRAGDLVFPHAGHVQLALGGGLVIEAPFPGAAVQISRLGSDVAIRRPC
jgi:cell wall-associated NlpC family hydrolase